MIADKQLKIFLDKINKLSQSYVSVLDETESKLEALIDISQSLQVKLDPLSQNIDQYQAAIKNMDTCRSELLKTKNFNKTGIEVESIIRQYPSGNLGQYLDAMDKLKIAIDYFKRNDPANPEHDRLEGLFNVGKEAIEREFEALLNQAFPILRSEALFNICFNKDTDTDSISSGHTINTLSGDIFDNVTEHHENELRRLSQWLLNDSGIKCIVKYCACRREALRTTMDRFKEYCRNCPNIDHNNVSMRTKVPTSKAAKRKTMSKKNANLLKEGHKRQGSEFKEEFEEKEASLFSMQLVALVKLMKNERLWLEKLDLTPDFKDKCGAMDSIVKGSVNDFLSDGDEIMKMMNRAQAKHQYHYVINLIFILERFIEVKTELREILESIMDHTKKLVFNLLNRLAQIINQCLEVYSSYVETERISGISGNYVPDDATVHELTTNTLRFLETLLLHGEITEWVLSNASLSDKLFPVRRDNAGLAGKMAGSQSNLLASASSAGDPRKKNPLLDYMHRVIMALIKNMFSTSMSYTDDFAKYIFQMNNAQYIMKTMETPEFYGTYHSLSQGFKDVAKTINDCKMHYIASFLKASNLPEKSLYSQFITAGSKVDSNTKVHVKDLWTRFNDSFKALSRSHQHFVMPDRDLRKALVTDLKASFVPRYAEFRDKFWTFGFTTKREKYIIYTREEVDRTIDHFFSQ